MIYLHREKAVISSSGDLFSISPQVSVVHFRKFLSKKLIFDLLERCDKIKKIIVSKSAYSRCDKKCIDVLEASGINVLVSKNRGRPSCLDLYNKEKIRI